MTVYASGLYGRFQTSNRPAHIHFQVTGKQDSLVTQMYFEGDPYNSADPFLSKRRAQGTAHNQSLRRDAACFEPNIKTGEV